MLFSRVFLFVMLSMVAQVFAAEPAVESVKHQLSEKFAEQKAVQWGERVAGVRTHLVSDKKLIALTLDACGSKHGMGYDAALIDFLIKNRIPATLFVNARWIDANREIFLSLARNPLFEIANHGLQHKPASVSGKSAYGIAGTRSVAELIDEIEGNARKIEALTEHDHGYTGQEPPFMMKLRWRSPMSSSMKWQGIPCLVMPVQHTMHNR